MKNLNEFVAKHKPNIQRELNNFLDKKLKTDDTQIIYYADFINRMVKFCSKGKMLRGLLITLAYEMNGKTADTNIYKTAAAIEIIHAGLLIHDDIIDQDDTRRGEKSIPAQYAEDRSKTYGESMAVCAADIAFFAAIELLAEVDNTLVIGEISKEIQRVAAAEMIDYHWGASDDEPNEAEILNLYKNKSARYTFTLPLKIGAMLANNNSETLRQLEEFGEKLGAVFQIVDDSIGLLGSEEKIGKPVGSDIRQNKKTLLRVYLFKKADAPDKKYLLKVFGNENITSNDIEKVKDLIHKYGISKQVDALSRSLSDESTEIIKKLNISEEHNKIFLELIDYNLKRAS